MITATFITGIANTKSCLLSQISHRMGKMFGVNNFLIIQNYNLVEICIQLYNSDIIE